MMSGFLCSSRVYKYNGWIFEWGHIGPWPLKKNGDPRKRMGMKFLKDINGFIKMSDKDKKEYNIGGGCVQW